MSGAVKWNPKHTTLVNNRIMMRFVCDSPLVYEWTAVELYVITHKKNSATAHAAENPERKSINMSPDKYADESGVFCCK